MAFTFGENSLKRLKGVNPELVRVVLVALSKSKIDFAVVQGLRTQAEQDALYAQGRTKPGPIVTWTRNSRHLGGFAVDLCPFVNGKLDWTAGKNFDLIAEAMFAAAKELGVKIRWGADWDQDGNPREKGESDSPHFEIAR